MLAIEGRKTLPRILCETPNGLAVSANSGLFGPHIRYGDKYISLAEEDDLYTIELADALELIAGREIADANRIILDFEEAGIQILGGRNGPYVTDKIKNTGDKETIARVPKDRKPESLTLEECKELLAAVERDRKNLAQERPHDPFLAKFDKPGIYVIRQNSNLCLVDMTKDLRVHLPENTEPSSLTLEECEKLLENADRIDRRVKNFEEAGLYIWEVGFFGSACVVDRRTDIIAKIPKGRDPRNLSLLDCRQLLFDAEASKLG